MTDGVSVDSAVHSRLEEAVAEHGIETERTRIFHSVALSIDGHRSELEASQVIDLQGARRPMQRCQPRVLAGEIRERADGRRRWRRGKGLRLHASRKWDLRGDTEGGGAGNAGGGGAERLMVWKGRGLVLFLEGRRVEGPFSNILKTSEILY